LNQYFLLVVALVLVTWLLVQLFFLNHIRFYATIVGFVFSLIQVGCAIWSYWILLENSAQIGWDSHWFSVATDQNFILGFTLESVSAFFWLILSLVIAAHAYFTLFNCLRKENPTSSLERAFLPLLSLGVFLIITSTQFLVLYFGWILVTFVSFLVIGFSLYGSDVRANVSFRYICLNILAEGFFLCGLLGCFLEYQSLDFKAIQKMAPSMEPSASFILTTSSLILGAMLKSFQIPFLFVSRYVAEAKFSATPIFLVVHILLPAALFLKISPIISTIPHFYFAAFLPALTVILAGFLMLSEKDPLRLCGWLVSYFSGSLFLSGLVGLLSVSQALALSAVTILCLLINVLLEVEKGEASIQWCIYIAGFLLVGVPGSSLFWARSHEYLGLTYLGLKQDSDTLNWVFWVLLGMKILSDCIIGFAVWRILKEIASRKSSKSKPQWALWIPFGTLVLSSVLLTLGFENILPSNFLDTKMYSELPDQTVFIMKGAAVLVFLLPFIISLLWFFRSSDAAEHFRKQCLNISKKLGFLEEKSLIWDIALKKGYVIAVMLFSFVEDIFLRNVLLLIWKTPARWIKKIFHTFEDHLLDKIIVDGLAFSVVSISKAIRLIQNGQVQFYLGVGLLFISVIIIHFLLRGLGV